MPAIEAAYKNHLRAVIREFARGYDRTVGTVCEKSPAQDGKFLARIEGGKGLTFRTYDAMITYFAEWWPPGVDWPQMPAIVHHTPEEHRDIRPTPVPRQKDPLVDPEIVIVQRPAVIDEDAARRSASDHPFRSRTSSRTKADLSAMGAGALETDPRMAVAPATEKPAARRDVLVRDGNRSQSAGDDFAEIEW